MRKPKTKMTISIDSEIANKVKESVAAGEAKDWSERIEILIRMGLQCEAGEPK